MNKFHKLLVFCCLPSFFALFAAPALATATLRLNDGSTTITVVDNGPSDEDVTFGKIKYTGTVGAWSGTTTAATARDASSPIPNMDLNVSRISSSAGTLTVSFSDDFFGPTVGIVSTPVTGTQSGGANNKITYATQISDSNTLFDGTALTSPYNRTQTGTTSSSYNNGTPAPNVAVVHGAYYALTQTITITHAAPPSTGFWRTSANAKIFAASGSGCIGDYVWRDSNANGIQDNNEEGINGVRIVLSDANGGYLTEVTTATNGTNDGYYQFSNLVSGNYKVMIDESTLPPGLVLTQSGAGGDPARDSNGSPAMVNLPTNTTCDQTIDFGYTCPVVTLSPSMLPSGTVGQPYSQQITASPGSGNTFMVSAGSLPPGLMLDPMSGLLSGTPASAGNFSFTIQATNGTGCAGSQQYTIRTDCFVVTVSPTSLPNATVGMPYSQQITASPGSGYTFTASGGNLPPGLMLNPGTGLLSGTPTAEGTFSFTVQATHGSSGCSGNRQYTVESTCPTILLSPTTLPGGHVAQPYSQQITASGGNGAYNFMVSDGSLPPGLTLLPSGLLSGTSTSSGNFSFTVTATDGFGCIGDQDYVVAVDCTLEVTKGCTVAPPPPAPFDCSGAKPITSLKMRWNGATGPVWIRAWNGAINGSGVISSDLGPVGPGGVITFTRTTTSTPNDIFFEVFSSASRSAASRIGTSTFHLSCSDSEMNGSEDCGKAEGDGKNNISSYLNTWSFEGLAGNGKTLECSSTPPTPMPTCDIPEAVMPNCTTAGKPTVLKFRYNARTGCGTPNNPQGGKFTCSGAVDPTKPITVTSGNGYRVVPTAPATVMPGGIVTISASSFSSQSTFTLKDTMGGVQSLSIHTSCSQPLAVGDIFGNLTLEEFNGQTGGTAVTYHYTVTNTGANSLSNNVYLEDDKLGPIEGPFGLAPGETKTFDRTRTLSAPVTNVATAYLLTGMNQRQCEDTASVTVNMPPNCPVWASAPAVSGKKLTRSISNTGASTITATGLSVSWPTAPNGKLLKIKLDGDVIWDKQAATSPITISSTDLTTTASRKSIDPGKTRVLTFEFQNYPSTTLSNYTISISFGSGCSLSF